MSLSSIAVVGAGILGLSTATLLQQRLPQHIIIIIIASEIPTSLHPTADYASVWAGAHYRPIPASTQQLRDEAELAIQTSVTMRQIAKESPEAGVAKMKGVEYLEAPTEVELRLKTGDVYAWPGDNFRILGEVELPEGVKWGCEYDTYCVNVPVYCRWLLQRFQDRGGRVLQYRLDHVEEAFDVAEKLGSVGKVEEVVNCSGRNFGRDAKMKIIRGQTVLVQQQYHQTVTRQCADGKWSFLIPRPGDGGTIVGGSKEIGDWESGVRFDMKAELLERATIFFPDFVGDVNDFKVVKNNVGRRPWRDGGLRIQAQTLPRGRTVVHGYGAGGRGYELSWCVAAKIADLVVATRTLRSSL